VSPESVENKLERLSRRVTTLEELPERMDRLELQILQLRDEMRAEFSAVRTEIRDGDAMVVTALTEQIEGASRHRSVLFEDAVGRIAVIGEGFEANVEGLKALDKKVDRFHASFTHAIDASNAELRNTLASKADLRNALEEILSRERRRRPKKRESLATEQKCVGCELRSKKTSRR
jgi:hypothetical protein